ncbi:MAG: hemerythrin domain-containing protein [Kiloniellaceae bacterium]
MLWKQKISSESAKRDPLELIQSEHRHHLELCDRVIALADQQRLEAVAEGAEMLLGHFIEGLPRHAEDEENDLLPKLKARCRPEDGIDGILSEIEREHAVDTFLAHHVVLDLKVLASGGKLDQPMRLFNNLRAFAEAQRRHLAWENAVVLPLARRRLGPADLEEMGHNMAARRGLADPARGGDPR